MDQVGQGLLDAAGIDKDLQILPKFVGRAGGGVALAIAGPAVIGAVGNTALGAGITGFVAAHVPAAAITYTGWGLAIAGASASVYSGYQHARAGEYDQIANDLTGLLGSNIVRKQSGRFAQTVVAKQPVRVYRVEGTPNTRVLIGENGTVSIVDDGSTLWLNFGSKARAEQYLAQKIAKSLPDAQVKSFDVPRSVLDDIRSSAVPESMARQFPGRPIISRDPAPDQFGLRSEQIRELIGNVIPGSGRSGF